MATDTPQLRTPGVIADELGAPLNSVLYVLRTQGHIIKPIGRAGILRLYDRGAVELVRQALRKMAKRKEVELCSA
jgi:hypothetical protein